MATLGERLVARWPRAMPLVYRLLHLGAFGAGGILMIIAASLLYLSPTLPPIEALLKTRLDIPLRVYTRDGKLLGSFGEQHRRELTYDEIPELFLQAILSAEDSRFHSHRGVDIRGLVRAATELVLNREIRSGGSTITMQVARNYLLTRKRSFLRKFKEVLLALKIESILSKERIMELYVNRIFLGHRAYGIAAAAEVYYGKNLAELNLPQLAMIAAIPKAPSRLNPLSNPAKGKERRDWIINRMHRLGFINRLQHRASLATPMSASYHRALTEVEAPYVAEAVRRSILKLIQSSAYTGGYRIYTTIDSRQQTEAVRAVRNGLLAYDRRHGFRAPPNYAELLGVTHIALLRQQLDPSSSALPVPSPKPHAEPGINPGQPPANPIPLPAVALSAVEQPAPDIVPVMQLLRRQPKPAGLVPALVIEVAEDGGWAQVLTQQQRLVLLHWPGLSAAQTAQMRRRNPRAKPPDHSLSWAAPAKDADTLGPPPTGYHELLQSGDLVHLQATEQGYQLDQLPGVQAALVSLNPNNGAIQALVGGYDFNISLYDRTVQAFPQAGSNIKPFIYSAALNHGLTAASIIHDSPVAIEDPKMQELWRPVNSSGRFYGDTRLREALIHSRNLVSVKLLRKIGLGKTIRFLARFGFNTKTMPHDLSLALGSPGISPLQMARAYATFANSGHLVNPHLIEHIEDDIGNIVLRPLYPQVCRNCTDRPDNLAADSPDTAIGLDGNPLPAPNTQPPTAPQVLEERIAYIIGDFLRDVIKHGTGRRALQLGRQDLAGKTATTNEATDTWFTGFNTQLVTTVWVGYDQPQSLGKREWGNTTALPIWIDYNRQALAGQPTISIEQPAGIVQVKIDLETGKRAQPGAQNSRFELFRAEHIPKESAPPKSMHPTSSPSPKDDNQDSTEPGTSTESIFGAAPDNNSKCFLTNCFN